MKRYSIGGLPTRYKHPAIQQQSCGVELPRIVHTAGEDPCSPHAGSARETPTGATVKQRSSKLRGEQRLMMVFMALIQVFNHFITSLLIRARIERGVARRSNRMLLRRFTERLEPFVAQVRSVQAERLLFVGPQ